jgi:hypothetical protein
MNRNSRGNYLLLAVVLLLVVFIGSHMNAHDKSPVLARAKEDPDPRREMITVLPTDGPHPSLGDKAKLFDHFVGTWETDFTFYAADGTVSKRKGEVLFGWIIDGRALQDIWISYPKEGERDLGTTIRFYDAKTAMWRVVWIYPAGSVITTLTGGAVGDRIVLRGQAADGGLLRWSFNEIRADSFVWRGEVSYNNGETWRLTGEYQMRRRKAGAG